MANANERDQLVKTFAYEWVCFNHDVHNKYPYLVTDVTDDCMLELEGMSGLFAPTCFHRGPAPPTAGADGRYCAHHDDDPAHSKECYVSAATTTVAPVEQSETAPKSNREPHPFQEHPHYPNYCAFAVGDEDYCKRETDNVIHQVAAPAPLADPEDEVALSDLPSSERLSTQEGNQMKNYDDFRAGMLRAAEMARNEFKRAPEAAKGHDCVYMSGYEDACDHLSAVIARAAVINSVRIAGPQPDWQYHISLLLPDGIEDVALLKIYQVVEYELRAAAASDSPTRARAAAEELKAYFTNDMGAAERAGIKPATVSMITEIIERHCFTVGASK